MIITKAEKADLLRIARLREKVAKNAAGQRSAELMADFEAQLATEYHFDQDKVWRAAKDIADHAVAEANAMVANRCEQLGIPRRFAPSLLSHYWLSQGSNATKEQKNALRKIAQSRIVAMEKSAVARIDAASAAIQTELLANGMSDTAQQLLDSMPTAERLLPRLLIGDVETLLLASKRE